MAIGKRFSFQSAKASFAHAQTPQVRNPQSAISTAALCNLGCSKNIVDGERMLHWLCSAGFNITASFADADIIVVNTCAFIKEAAQEAVDAILEMAALKKSGRCRVLAVAGCFSQRYCDEAARKLPEVDAWIPVKDWEKAFRRLFGKNTSSSFHRRLTETYGGQYLKIAEGCSHRCTFCVIPAIRGHYQSRPVGEIMQEAKWLYEQGVRECILVSQDTSYYGRDIGSSIAALLDQLLNSVGFPWIRLMYLNPRWVDEVLIRLIASEPRLCSYYDLPLQHSAEPLLRAMRRTLPAGGARRLLERIRTIDPRAAIRTSFIVGFPGETEEHFHDLLRFVEDSRFDKLGVFPYSAEEGTPAAAMPHRPRNATVMRRCEELMSLQREISRELLSARLGRTMQVMIDGPAELSGYAVEGRTEFDAPEVDGRVFITSSRPLLKGTFARVRIAETGDYDLYGKAE